MKQKLISIYLTDVNSAHLEKVEHLSDYLNDGWSISSITALNGSGGGDASVSAGWIVVFLEKS